MCACERMKKHGILGNEREGTHPKLESLHLCCAAIADDNAVGTERVITGDILSERLSRTLGIGARFLAEAAFIPEVRREKLSLTRKLAARLSVQAFDGELIYHLRKITL